jgi:hypothetical protein
MLFASRITVSEKLGARERRGGDRAVARSWRADRHRVPPPAP